MGSAGEALPQCTKTPQNLQSQDSHTGNQLILFSSSVTVTPASTANQPRPALQVIKPARGQSPLLQQIDKSFNTKKASKMQVQKFFLAQKKHLQRKQQKRIKLQQKLVENKMSKYTFNPKIDKNSRKLAKQAYDKLGHQTAKVIQNQSSKQEVLSDHSIKVIRIKNQCETSKTIMKPAPDQTTPKLLTRQLITPKASQQSVSPSCNVRKWSTVVTKERGITGGEIKQKGSKAKGKSPLLKRSQSRLSKHSIGSIVAKPNIPKKDPMARIMRILNEANTLDQDSQGAQGLFGDLWVDQTKEKEPQKEPKEGRAAHAKVQPPSRVNKSKQPGNLFVSCRKIIQQSKS